MQILRTNLTPGMTVLLVILAILFAFVIIPLLVIGWVCWEVCKAVTGRSPLDLFLRGKNRRRSNIYEGPFDHAQTQDNGGSSASDDDTIECEVISARTFDEDGREIR